MKTYFASGFGELEVSWRWFGYAGLLIISMGFCNPCVCTNASVSGKGAGSISSAVASRKLEQSTALRSAEQLSKGGNDLKKKKKGTKAAFKTDLVTVLHPVKNFPSPLPCQYLAGRAHRGEPRCELHPARHPASCSIPGGFASKRERSGPTSSWLCFVFIF